MWKFQLIELHCVLAAEAEWQDIEFAGISQRVWKRFCFRQHRTNRGVGSGELCAKSRHWRRQ
jgi:hypothetical protein